MKYPALTKNKKNRMEAETQRRRKRGYLSLTEETLVLGELILLLELIDPSICSLPGIAA